MKKENEEILNSFVQALKGDLQFRRDLIDVFVDEIRKDDYFCGNLTQLYQNHIKLVRSAIDERKKQLLSTRNAAKMLEVHPKTLLRNFEKWELNKIHTSVRSCRFVRGEIEELADRLSKQ